MPYVITNGANYMQWTNDNRPSTTGNPANARVFESKVKAQNCCVCLPNTFKKFGFYVQEVGMKPVGDRPTREDVEEKDTERFANMPLRKDVPAAEGLDERVLDIDFVSAEMSRFEDFVSLLRSSMPALQQQLAHAEAQIFDIEHAAELENLNVYQGYKIYKALHDARVLRRKCKDTIDIIGRLSEIVSDEILSGYLTAHIEGLNNRTYTPRAIPELFEDIRRRTKT